MADTITNGNANKTKRSASSVPDWLKSELFKDILIKNVPNFKTITDFQTFDALKAGENYATKILSIEIEVELNDGTKKMIYYIIKLPHFNNMYEEFTKVVNIFQIEAGMFSEYVPEMQQMYKDVGIDIRFGAKYNKLPIDKDNVLLEDLRPSGFKNANRLECLDLEHAKCVLKKLAQWHAATATRVATKGMYPEQYSIGFFSDACLDLMEQMGEGLRKPFQKCVSTYEGHELYADAMLNLSKNMAACMIKYGKADKNEFNVLNHGDCWSNNIMFQYDAFGKIKETYFVDYQIPHYGSPAQDLYYFIMSSTKIDIKLKQFDYMIKYYHDNLVENLNLLKYPKKVPTLKELHISLLKYGIWGCSTASGVLPIVLLDPTDKASFENLLTDSAAGVDFKMLMFTNNRYRKHIELILPWLYNRGAMEF